jgi:GNAT superfamily N-acetyltransferase
MLSWHHASNSDLPLLAEWNHQLIRDEGHRNPMTVPELEARMSQWLRSDYRAIVFTQDNPVAYALYRVDPDQIYLRQLFVCRDKRRRGIGRGAFAILKNEIWPKNVRLTVDVLCQNTRAIEFWRSIGYRDYCLTMEMMPKA